jgi:NTP pyrophosphatase (non-canonical NTP hydrolase)
MYKGGRSALSNDRSVRRLGASAVSVPVYLGMSLADSQARVDRWISQFEEGYFHPLTNMARLSEEVGELAREINHRFGQKPRKPEEAEGDLAMEMADIIFVLICLANREGIDLQEAFDRMMTKVEVRDANRWTRRQEKTS